MAFLPDSTNSHYKGARWAYYVLGLAALQTMFVGLMQVVLPDSGLIVVAGVDVSHEGGLLMIALAASAGATQLVWGAAMGLVAVRYRTLTLPFLGLLCLERGLIVLSFAVKPTNGDPPPGMTAAMIIMVVSAVAVFGARAKA